MISRRVFLRNGSLALVSLGFAPSFLARTAAASGRGGKVLIAIFQRGAVDGLNMVVPFGERAYYSARPSIAIAQPGRPTTPPSTSTASSGFIRDCRRSSRCTIDGSSRSFTPAGRTTARDRTSTRRTTWKAGRPASRARGMLAQPLLAGPRD